MNAVTKYGLSWGQEFDMAQVERFMIQHGGQWRDASGRLYGNGLMFHFKQYWSFLWPEDSQTWWTDLILKEILANQFTSLVGPASAWKSGTVSRLALMDWSCFPDCTTVLMSSTDMEGLKARIYGETSKMWLRASERYDWFPGHPLDSKCVIAFEDVDVNSARDIRNSIVGVPCKTSAGKFLGMGKYSGRKNRRVWCIGDEQQFMEPAILDAQANLISNGPNLVPGLITDKADLECGKPLRGYKCVFVGNTNPTRPDNPLHLVSEPDLGWGSIAEDNKTKVWDCKRLPNHPIKCRCISLDAADSPNNAYPIKKPKWPHLAGAHKLESYTEGSESYWSQGRGVFKFGLSSFKIITKELCDQFHAFDPLLWLGTETTKIGMLDAAYGTVGGDRCALGWLEFGRCHDDIVRVLFHPYWLVPVSVRPDMIPEDQIAMFCRDKMETLGIPPENLFFDGRGTLAMSFARIWSPKVNAIEFGGRATEREVDGEFVLEENGVKRPKLAVEHYSKFVTELWFSMRFAIEADQVRGLSMAIVLDAQPREWKKVSRDRKEAETKKEMKKRTGVSPDLADMAVIGLEGARRRGFQIARLGGTVEREPASDWLREEAERYRKVMDKTRMQHV